MGFNFRKSIKVGPARVNLSKSGVGYSVGAGGLRYTKNAKRGKSGGNSGCFGWLGKLILAMALLGVAINYIDVIGFLLIIAALVALAVFFAVKVYKSKQMGTLGDGDSIESSKTIGEKEPESEVKVYRAAGVEYYLDDLISMMVPNYLYDYKKQELIDTCNVDRPIYRQTIDGQSLRLVPEPDNPHDPNAIKIMIGEKKVGYIAAKDCAHLLNVIDNDLALNIHCEVSGGKYKMVNEDYDYEKDKSHYTMEYGEDSYGITLYIREKL